MAKVKELREKLVPIVKSLGELRDKAHTDTGFTAEDRANWDKVNKDYDALKSQIEIGERAEALEDDLAKPRDNQDRKVGRGDSSGKRGNPQEPTEEQRTLSLQAWCRRRVGKPLSEEHREACEATGVDPEYAELGFKLPDSNSTRAIQERAANGHPVHIKRAVSEEMKERRASLSAQTGGSGAYTIPTGFVMNLEAALLYFGGIRQTADVLRTDNGEDMPWPTFNDTSNKGRRIAENTQVDLTGAVTPAPTYAQTILRAWKYTSDPLLVPTKLLEDSAFQLPEFLGEKLGERIGRICNTENTLGTGNSQPMGLATAATVGITAATSGTIVADELIKTIHSIDPAYRNNGCGWMMHDQIILLIRLLKDGQGQYLWKGGLEMGVADRLLGYVLTTNNDMQSTAGAGKPVALFGQFKKYKVREVKDVRLYWLKERFRDYDQDGFVAFFRQDGQLLDAGTHPVKSYVN